MVPKLVNAKLTAINSHEEHPAVNVNGDVVIHPPSPAFPRSRFKKKGKRA